MKSLLADAEAAGDPVSIPQSGRSLEKEMAIHSSILAWKISWKEEPEGLQSTGSQRVGYNQGLTPSLKHRVKSNTPFL